LFMGTAHCAARSAKMSTSCSSGRKLKLKAKFKTRLHHNVASSAQTGRGQLTQGQFGVNLGSIGGQSGVNLHCRTCWVKDGCVSCEAAAAAAAAAARPDSRREEALPGGGPTATGEYDPSNRFVTCSTPRVVLVADNIGTAHIISDRSPAATAPGGKSVFG
jgi:hypothetical protein